MMPRESTSARLTQRNVLDDALAAKRRGRIRSGRHSLAGEDPVVHHGVTQIAADRRRHLPLSAPVTSFALDLVGLPGDLRDLAPPRGERVRGG
jgi:hypothetical protein